MEAKSIKADTQGFFDFTRFFEVLFLNSYHFSEHVSAKKTKNVSGIIK